jgi:sugar phosphate isomerase/epimerase
LRKGNIVESYQLDYRLLHSRGGSVRLSPVAMITRRRFLVQSCTAVAASFLADAVSAATGRSAPAIHFPAAARQRIAVASYPFREFIVAPNEKASSKIELKDFPAHVISKFNVNKVELWSAHFPSTDAAYLHDFQKALKAAKAEVVDIAVDGEASPYAIDPSEREKAIAFSKHWVDVAAAIGSPSVRTNIPEAKDAKPDVDRLAASLSRVVEHAATRNVVVHLENDNPVSEDPFFLVKVIEKVNHPWLHALPDFANTLAAHDAAYAYSGLDAMFAHAYGICHVKEVEINPAGQTVHADLRKTFAMLRHHDYRGYCSMEFDSPGDPYAGTSTLIAETVRYLGGIAA